MSSWCRPSWLFELRAAFQIGFVIFLPFLLIDLLVSTLLMMRLPPAPISLPFKILMFILVDGWGLLLRGHKSMDGMGSFKPE